MNLDIEGAAAAAYEAAVTIKGPRPHEPWETLPEYWKRIYRRQAQAVVDYMRLRAPIDDVVVAIPGQLDLFGGEAS